MESRKFSDVLRGAIAGEHDAVMAIIYRYLPLINRHCMADGILDEDLRQYIMMDIVRKLRKFDPDRG